MAETLKQTEAAPASYPHIPGLLDAAALLESTAWQRIEVYTAHRFTERSVTWIVKGPGAWVPPLTPATGLAAEVWQDGAWKAATPAATPLGGYDLACDGPYRVTATVGDGPVPAAVAEAVRRLAEYLASPADDPGTTRVELREGELHKSLDRAATWQARAMQYSGAADLLRPYRRA